MRKTFGHQSSSTNSCTINGYDYKTSKFCIAIDTEKVLEAVCIGLNTRAGDLLTVKFKFNTPAAGGAVDETRIANLMHIVLYSDYILEIYDTEVVI